MPLFPKELESLYPCFVRENLKCQFRQSFGRFWRFRSRPEKEGRIEVVWRRWLVGVWVLGWGSSSRLRLLPSGLPPIVHSLWRRATREASSAFFRLKRPPAPLWTPRLRALETKWPVSNQGGSLLFPLLNLSPWYDDLQPSSMGTSNAGKALKTLN